MADVEHAAGQLRIPQGVGVVKGSANGAHRGIGVVVSRFNGDITTRLLEGALETQHRHNTTDRPPYTGRNTGLGPSYWTFDTRLQRGFSLTEKVRLDLMFEAFNLFNKLNYQSVNNTVGATFVSTTRAIGRPDRSPTDPLGFTSAFDPRRIQLGFRLAF